MASSRSDNNTEMLNLIKAIGSTPGFRLADAASGNFKAVRMALTYGEHVVDEAHKHLSIRSKGKSFLDTVNDLERKLGWTQQLHDDLEEIARTHRLSGDDPTTAITERLLDSFIPGWNLSLIHI